MKRIIAVAIVAAMLSVSFAVGVSINTQADFVDTNDTNIGIGWLPWDFTPLDIAWNDAGSVAVVVGQYVSGPNANVWVYDHFEDSWTALQAGINNPPADMNGVCYDNVNKMFWIVGVKGTMDSSSIYSYDPDGKIISYPQGLGGGGPLTKTMSAVACDNWGNPLGVGGGDMPSDMYYFDLVSDNWFGLNMADSSACNFHSVDFNTNDGRFYAVGEYSTQSTAWFTNSTLSCPLTASSTATQDASGFMVMAPFNGIAWNQLHDYGLVVGTEGLYRVSAVSILNSTGTMGWSVIRDGTPCNDVAWDTDGWDEAAIVGGTFGDPSHANYWRYYDSNPTLILGSQTEEEPYQCVSIKPPASPKMVFIPTSGGGVSASIMANDQSTRITANAAYPKLWWIGFNDTSSTSRLDQQVPVNDWYNFTLQSNYSQGWTSVEIEITAWYDWGLVGTNSVYPAETDNNRDLAFRLIYTVGTGLYTLMYPVGDLEVIAGTSVIDVDMADHTDSTQNNHTVSMPIYLGSQIRNATGQGFGSGDPDFDTDKNIALQDAWSWDFNVTVRDSTSATAMNYSHGEFGIDETVSVSVTGNPSGNAPPGSANVVLADPSQITCSSNTNYWINVSIPDLLVNGVGPSSIPATGIEVQNIDPYANGTNSGISAMTYITGAGNNMEVWGLAGSSMTAPSNGTTTCGPWVTNYNAAGLALDEFTILNWQATVPAGTPEGIYWAIITVTIEN